jgi:CubicO group peptidase (beta-lactamase class C family)
LFALGIVATALLSSVAAAQTSDSNRFAAIDHFVMQALHADRVPGAALAIVHGDSIVHLRGFGTAADGRAITGDTPFVIGSMSKTFTAMAVMQLVEQGRVDLDAPAQRYLPWFRVADSVASRTITVRQLLLHTSGIPTAAPRATDDDRTLASHVRALQQVPLASAPGTAHRYASPNYLVLGAIVEAISGLSFAEYVQQRIFTPLGMTHSHVDHGAAIADGMAQGHRYWFGFPVAATLSYESDRLPTASLISSAGDLARFLIAQRVNVERDSGNVLSQAGLAAMQTGGVEADGFAYAFGWRVSSFNGVRAVHHGGIVPNFRGKMAMLPDSGWGVVVLTNASSSLPLPLAPTSHRIADAVAASLAGAALGESGSRFRVMHWALLATTLLILASQLRVLWRLTQGRAPTPPRATVLRNILFDAAWIAFALFLLPRLVGITWSELFRGSPDLAWSLAVMLLLSVAAVALRTRILTRPG